jgi:hypothetical protein
VCCLCPAVLNAVRASYVGDSDKASPGVLHGLLSLFATDAEAPKLKRPAARAVCP